MKNIFFALSCILFLSNIVNSQNFKISKVIVDSATKLPLENVSIYNDKDNSITNKDCLLYTSPSPRDRQKSRMPSSA